MKIKFNLDGARAVTIGRSVPGPNAEIEVRIEDLDEEAREVLASAVRVRDGAFWAGTVNRPGYKVREVMPIGVTHEDVAAELRRHIDDKAREEERQRALAKERAEEERRAAEEKLAKIAKLEALLPAFRIAVERLKAGDMTARDTFQGLKRSTYSLPVDGSIVREWLALDAAGDAAIASLERALRDRARLASLEVLAAYCGFEGEDRERLLAGLMPDSEVWTALHGRVWPMLGILDLGGGLGLAKRPRHQASDLGCECGADISIDPGIVSQSRDWTELTARDYRALKAVKARLAAAHADGPGRSLWLDSDGKGSETYVMIPEVEVEPKLAYAECQEDSCSARTTTYRVFRLTAQLIGVPSSFTELVRDFVITGG